MPTFIYPPVNPDGSSIPDDGSPILTVSNPSTRQYDPTTLDPIQLAPATVASESTGTFTLTVTIVTESGAFSDSGESGPWTDGELVAVGTLAEINSTLGDLWFKPATGSQNTIAYTITVEDDDGKTGETGEPIQIVNSQLFNDGVRASATVTLSGSSGTIIMKANGLAINSVVSFTTNLDTTVTNLVTAINDFSGTPKYKATKLSSTQFKIEAPLTFGSTANTFPVTATVTGTLSISGDSELKGGVTRVQKDLTLGDKLLKGALDLLPTAAGAVATGLILRNMSKVQVEVNVDSTDETPDVAVLYDCQLVSVPLGYTPPQLSDDGEWTPAVYPASWDYATFETEKVMCYNPALCWLEMLKNKRWGTASTLPLGTNVEPRLNKAVWAIMPRCDEMVKTGYRDDAGNQILEPRYSINTLINGMTKKEALEAIASVFDAMVVYADNGIHLKPDMPDVPKRVVTNANVGAGEFHFSGGSMNSLYNWVDVEFNNPSRFYNLEKVWAADVANIQKFGEKKTAVRAFGCASEGQAKRKARYILLNEKSDPKMVSYVAGFDHCDLIPGDLVVVVDNSLQPIGSVRSGGRISGFNSSTSIILDRTITLPGSGTYYLNISMPDNTVASRQVTAVTTSGGKSTVTIASAFPTINGISIGHSWVWTFTEADVSDITYKIVSRNERQVGAYEITAIKYDADKYNDIDNF